MSDYDHDEYVEFMGSALTGWQKFSLFIACVGLVVSILSLIFLPTMGAIIAFVVGAMLFVIGIFFGCFWN